MSKEWHIAASALSSIKITSTPKNGQVAVHGSSPYLRCIGVGTDAAVFRHTYAPSFAFKVYAEDRLYKKDIEQTVYERLGVSSTLSKLHDAGDRYLVLNYEQGPTLYDCLLQGIHIPPQVIKDVEETRAYIRKCGLNPRDIHLKNILLQNGRAKILDVSEYINPGNDFRWEHLKKGYEIYYPFIDGKPIPYRLLETIRKWYNQVNDESFIVEDFLNKIAKLTIVRK